MTERARVNRVIGALSWAIGMVADLPQVRHLRVFRNQIVVEHDGKQFLVTVTQIRKPREPK